MAHHLSRACGICAALALMLAPTLTPGAEPSPDRVRELVHMVRQDCGSCHGLTLKGGIGPALLPESLRGKPAEALRSAVLFGRPGTPMPGWNAFLTEAEADWIVRQLMAGFPEENAR